MNDTNRNAHPPPEPGEAQRIREVYAAYKQKGWGEKKWSARNPGNWAILAERRREMRRLVSQAALAPLSARTILEVGCGAGEILRELLGLGATPKNCYGLDLIPERVAQAHKTCPKVHFRVGDAQDLPYRDDAFDLVLAFTVFSSIGNERVARNIAREIDRVLRPGGSVLWYDLLHNNPANPKVRGIRKVALRSLFPGYRSSCRTLTVLPPLVRRLGWFVPALYPALSALRLLHTHLMASLTKGH